MEILTAFVGLSIVIASFYNAYKLRGGRLSNQAVLIGVGVSFITLSALVGSFSVFFVDEVSTEVVKSAFLLLGLVLVFLGVKITWDAFKS